MKSILKISMAFRCQILLLHSLLIDSKMGVKINKNSLQDLQQKTFFLSKNKPASINNNLLLKIHEI